VDESAHDVAAARCRQTRERRFSLTDTASLDCMTKRGITQAIAQDEHFVRAHITLP
jgi:predicted nucleic acid-binding protein